MLENWLSKSKQSCLPGFTNLLPIPVVFLPNFKFFYQTLSNLEPNFSIFLTAFGKLLPRPIYWHWRNNLKLNFSMLTRKISTVNTFGTLLLTVDSLDDTYSGFTKENQQSPVYVVNYYFS